MLRICSRYAEVSDPLQGYSGQSDSFPREHQLQSILTVVEVLGQVLAPGARLLFRFSNVRWFVCVLGVAWALPSEVMNQASFVVHVVACTHPRSTLAARLLHQARQTIRLCTRWKLTPLPPRPRPHGNANGHFHLSWTCKNAVSHFVHDNAKSSSFTNN